MRDPLRDQLWLTAALMTYDTDAPHVHTPAEQNHYPPISTQQVLEWRTAEHCGDCTNRPQPCMRCWADECWHQAGWLIDRAAKAAGGQK